MARNFATTPIDPLIKKSGTKVAEEVDAGLGRLIRGFLGELQKATDGDDDQALVIIQQIDQAGGLVATLRNHRQAAAGAIGTGGGGSGSGGTWQDVSRALVADPGVSDGQFQGARRILDPTATDKILVDDRGLPNELADQRQKAHDREAQLRAALDAFGLPFVTGESATELKDRVTRHVPLTAPIVANIKTKLGTTKAALSTATDGGILRGGGKVLPEVKFNEAKQAVTDALGLLP